MTFDIHFILPRHDRAESLIGHRSEYLISRGNQPVVRRCKESLLIGLSVAYMYEYLVRVHAKSPEQLRLDAS